MEYNIYYIILYYIVLYCIVLYYIILHYIILYYIILYYIILYYIWFLAAIYEWNIMATIYIELYYLEPQVTSIFEDQPLQNKAFPKQNKGHLGI